MSYKLLSDILHDSGTPSTSVIDGKALTIAPDYLLRFNSDGQAITGTKGSFAEYRGTITSGGQYGLTNNISQHFIAGSSTRIDFVVPENSEIGDIIKITGSGTGGWSINRQPINAAYTRVINCNGSSVSGINSVHYQDCIELVCTATHSTWTVTDLNGHFPTLGTRTKRVADFDIGNAATTVNFNNALYDIYNVIWGTGYYNITIAEPTAPGNAGDEIIYNFITTQNNGYGSITWNGWAKFYSDVSRPVNSPVTGGITTIRFIKIRRYSMLQWIAFSTKETGY